MEQKPPPLRLSPPSPTHLFPFETSDEPLNHVLLIYLALFLSIKTALLLLKLPNFSPLSQVYTRWTIQQAVGGWCGVGGTRGQRCVLYCYRTK